MPFDELKSEDELLRRLPEINRIENPELRQKVESTFLELVPSYFWEIPASSSGKYHQNDAVGQHGLLIHVKRTFVVVERMIRSGKHSGMVSDTEADYLRAGILLHDCWKQGREPRGEHHTTDDHDVLARRILDRNTELPEEVLGLVESHNGPWKEGKEPENNLEQLHHLADMIGSSRNLIGKVYKPCEEVRKVFDQSAFEGQEGLEASF
jgi:hypothetical protein